MPNWDEYQNDSEIVKKLKIREKSLIHIQGHESLTITQKALSVDLDRIVECGFALTKDKLLSQKLDLDLTKTLKKYADKQNDYKILKENMFKREVRIKVMTLQINTLTKKEEQLNLLQMQLEAEKKPK